MYNGASWWGQAFNHWCLAVFFVGYTWLYNIYIYIYAFSRRFYPKRLTLHSSYSFTFYQRYIKEWLVFLLSFSLSLPFDWTLRCWVCVCCFVLLYSGCYVVLCVKKLNKKTLITKKKKTLFPTYCTLLLLLYAPPFWNASIFTTLIVLRSEACSDWPQAWDGNVTPLTVLWCRIPARPHKNNKTHYKKGICCIQWDIITDYNDLYCLFTHCAG